MYKAGLCALFAVLSTAVEGQGTPGEFFANRGATCRQVVFAEDGQLAVPWVPEVLKKANFPPASNNIPFGGGNRNAGSRIKNWSLKYSGLIDPDEDIYFEAMDIHSFGDVAPNNAREFEAKGISDLKDVLASNISICIGPTVKDVELVFPVWRNSSKTDFALKPTDFNMYAAHAWGLLKNAEMFLEEPGNSPPRRIASVAIILSPQSSEVLRSLGKEISTKSSYTLRPDQKAFNQFLDLPEAWIVVIAITLGPVYFHSPAITSIAVKQKVTQTFDDGSDDGSGDGKGRSSECEIELEPLSIWFHF